MADHLTPGGVLIVDGWVRPDAWIDGGSTHIETAETDDIKIARVGRTSREGSVTRLEMHHLVASRSEVEYLVDHHELTLFEPTQYEHAMTSAGLSIEVTDSPMAGRDRYIGTRL
jgi:hypothetical protein